MTSEELYKLVEDTYKSGVEDCASHLTKDIEDLWFDSWSCREVTRLIDELNKGLGELVTTAMQHGEVMEDLPLQPTQRGFARAEFVDLYGSECSIQESSLATDSAIWLGVDKSFDEAEAPRGSHRMHLNQEHVRRLLPLLVRFIETGRLFDMEAAQK